MASTYSSLKIQLMATGENSGTWGNVTNDNLGIAIEEAIVGSADVSFSNADVTLTLTNTNATQTARNLRLNLIGTAASPQNLIVPAIEKVYIINNGLASTITVKNTTGTGIAVPAGKTMYVYNNGTNVVDAITHLTSLTLGTPLPIASGGTGSNTATFSGANITNLNASSISSGTISNDRTTASASNGASTIVARNASGDFTARNVSATNFIGTLNGSGSNVSSINASNISSGTLSNDRTTASSANGASTIVARDASGNFSANVITANGSSISAINASNISTGTLANARTTGSASNGANTLVLRDASGNFTTNNVTANNLSGAGAGITSINASNISTGTLGNARTTASASNGANTIVARDASGNFAANVITANGSSITAINASNISSGTLSNDRLNTVSVAKGGTGSTTLTNNAVIVGNATNAVKFVSPGTSGNVLTSNGTSWVSQELAAGGGLTNNVRQAVTSSASTTIDVAAGNVVDLNMASNITTLAFSNVPASGTPVQVVLVVKNAADGTAHQIAWPSSIYWNGNSLANTLNGPALFNGPNGITVIALLTTDGGTKWRGWVEASIVGGSQNSLWSWGNAGDGILGQNNQVNYSSPVQVGASTDWKQVAINNDNQRSAIAVKTDGTLWSWGINSSGQLGQNNQVDYSSPVQVGASTNWVYVDAKGTALFALNTQGNIFSMGGSLNSNIATSGRSSPVLINGGSGPWVSFSVGISHILATKVDGTLWAWGAGSSGILGQNNTTSYSSPVQVGASTDWKSVSSNGSFEITLALKTNNTLWSWGANTTGGLGQNDIISRSSPVQVGASTDWAYIAAGARNYGGAIKTNGTLWMWGANRVLTFPYGNLGTGDALNRSSPTQIGNLTTWTQLSCGYLSTFALQSSGTVNPA